MAVEGITIVFEGNTVSFDKGVDAVEKGLKVLKKQTTAYMKEFKKTNDITALRDSIRSLLQEQKLAKIAVREWANEYTNLKNRQTELQKVGKDLSDKEKARMESAMNHWEDSKKRLTQIGIQIQKDMDLMAKFVEQPKTLAENLAEAGDKMVALGEATRKLSQASQQFLKDAVNEAIKFEDAFADVKKTVEETKTTSYEDIAQGLRELAQTVPTTADELAKIAGLAGQMGVNADDIVMFTKAMVDFGNATNITAEEAAQEIAQIYNVIGKGGDYSTLENLLSTIVDLGNNSATTEKEIVEMFKNISAASSRVGMTEQQMAALAATLSSLGLDKGGASSISTIMTKIDMAVSTNSKTLKDWADAAGMSVYQFKQAWGEDAAQTLSALLENLKATVDAGGNLNREFEDLGIKEMRRVDTLGRLVNATDVYNDALRRADAAFVEGNALSLEASKRYETLKSKLQILKNKFDEFKRSIGESLTPILSVIVDFAGKIIDFLNQLPGGINTLITVLTTLMAVLSPLMTIGGKYLTNLVKTDGILGKLVSNFKGFYGVIGTVIAGLVALYLSNEDFRNAINQSAREIWSVVKPALENLWTIFKSLWEIISYVIDKVQDLMSKFLDTTAGQVFIGTIKAIIEIVKVATQIIGGLIEVVKNAFNWFKQLIGVQQESNAIATPRNYVNQLSSGGYGNMMSGGISIQNSFTINGTEQLSHSRLLQIADVITDRVNENLGVAV